MMISLHDKCRQTPTLTDISPVADLTENVPGLKLISPKWTLKMGTETTRFSASNGLLNLGKRIVTSARVDLRLWLYFGP